MGETVASHTSPDTAKNGILTVLVDSPQWMHHLSFYKEEMTGKLKGFGISEVRFRIGKVTAGGRKRHETPGSALSDDDQRFIENTLKGIRDEELRSRFRRLITHGLTRGRK
jgi:hypothetical protein